MAEKGVKKILLIKSGFWYVVSNFLTRAVVFITMPIFTRLMSKEEYGDFSIFATWQNIMLMICGIEVYQTLNRARFDFTEKRDLDGYITSALMVSTIFTATFLILYIVFQNIFNRIFLLDKRYMMVMFAYLFSYPSFLMFQAKQRIEYKYKLSAAISFILSISSAVAAVLLALAIYKDRLLGRIIGQFGLTIITGLCFYVYFICCSRTVTVKAIKFALRYGVPFIFSYIGSQIMLSSDSLVVKHLCMAEQVSYLSVTHTASQTVILLVQTLNTAWSPWLYDMLRIGNRKEIRKTYQIYLWGAVLCTFGILLIGPEIISILGGSKYEESACLLPPVIFSGVFTVLIAQFGYFETYHKKPEYASILVSTAAVLNVLLNIVGVRLGGYRAVCYTTVFCQLLLIGLHYIATLGMGIQEILPFKSMIFVLGVSVAQIPVALLLYRSKVARYTCIAALFFIAVIFVAIYRKKIIRIVNSLRKEN